jgi:nucleotide-binding universal stress UspA family protein
MRRLLVPLDGSAFAESALPYAVTVAQGPTPCAIDLVGVDVPEPPVPEALAYNIMDAMREAEAHSSVREQKLRQYLHDMAVRLRAALPSVQIDTVVRRGLAAHELAAHAEEVDADLTVLTTHGRGGWDRLWFGSVTMDLLRRVNRPVLAVRPAPVPRDYLPLSGAALNTAVVAIDERLEPEPALAALKSLAGHAVDSITLLHVALAPPRALGRVIESESREALALRTAREASRLLSLKTDALTPRPHRVSALVLEGADPADVLLAHVDTHGTHLMVLTTTSYHAVERLLFGSVADRLLQRASVPLLLVPRARD